MALGSRERPHLSYGSDKETVMPLPLLVPQSPLTAPKPALKSAQLQEKLKTIPIYLVVDAKGTPLTASSGEKSFVTACLRRTSADALLANIKKNVPGINAEKVVVVPLSVVQAQLNSMPKPLPLGFVPDPDEVMQATAFLKAKGSEKPFVGVPLFYAKVKGKGYLVYNQAEKQYFPVYFSLAAIKPVIERFNQVRPAGEPEAEIEVTSLESMLLLMAAGADSILPKLVFVPAQAALEEAKAMTTKPPQP